MEIRSFRIALLGILKEKSSVKIGYVMELYNNSFTFDVDTIPEIQMYPFENIHDIRKKILYLANKNGIIEHCFNRILNEDNIKVTSWNERILCITIS